MHFPTENAYITLIFLFDFKLVGKPSPFLCSETKRDIPQAEGQGLTALGSHHNTYQIQEHQEHQEHKEHQKHQDH